MNPLAFLDPHGCPKCGLPLHKPTERCPSCGTHIENAQRMPAWFRTLVVTVLSLFVLPLILSAGYFLLEALSALMSGEGLIALGYAAFGIMLTGALALCCIVVGKLQTANLSRLETPVVQPYFCRSCGIALGHAHEFCPQCGVANSQISVPYWLRALGGLILIFAAIVLVASGTWTMGSGQAEPPFGNGAVSNPLIGIFMLLGAAFCVWAAIKLMK